MRYFISTILFTCLLSFAAGQEQITRILFIYDASNSMHGQWKSKSKHEVAKNFLIQTLDSLKDVPNLELALRVYGHQKSLRNGQDCNDTKLEVPFKKGNVSEIQNKLKTIRPKGTTPIAKSLEECARDFPKSGGNYRNVVILITDGIEECDGDPCAVSRALQSRGIILKPFVIGVNLLPKYKLGYECIGKYYDAVDESSFESVINVVISQAINNTTAQINLLDESYNPTETNVPVVLYNHTDGKIEQTMIHTMNGRGNPDTLDLDPSIIYDVTAYTLPSVSVSNEELEAGKHNIIDLDTPQGVLKLKPNGKGQRTYPSAIVRKTGTMATINAQRLNTSVKYLTGVYDLEILTLPRVYINDVSINQDQTTTIEIPPAGLVTIQLVANYQGAIFVRKGDKLEWVVNIDNTSTYHQTVNLQPGEYIIIYRSKNSSLTIESKRKEFKVQPAASVVVKL